jgi:hypothetical protein
MVEEVVSVSIEIDINFESGHHFNICVYLNKYRNYLIILRPQIMVHANSSRTYMINPYHIYIYMQLIQFRLSLKVKTFDQSTSKREMHDVYYYEIIYACTLAA